MARNSSGGTEKTKKIIRYWSIPVFAGRDAKVSSQGTTGMDLWNHRYGPHRSIPVVPGRKVKFSLSVNASGATPVSQERDMRERLAPAARSKALFQRCPGNLKKGRAKKKTHVPEFLDIAQTGEVRYNGRCSPDDAAPTSHCTIACLRLRFMCFDLRLSDRKM
jgi:hypothetical protein